MTSSQRGDGRYPDFLVFGAPKCGTTSIYRWLDQHPEIYMSDKKEPHFFAYPPGETIDYRGPRDSEVVERMYVRDPAEYRGLFAGASGRRCGEASAMHLYYSGAARRAVEAQSDIRLVISLRDPVQRAFSNFLHLRRDGREPIAGFEEALAAEERRIASDWMPIWHYTGLSHYAPQLVEVLRSVPREQVEIVIFEEVIETPRRALAELCEFIGVDSDFSFELDVRRNRSGVPRSKVAHSLYEWMRWGEAVKGIVRSLLGRTWARQIKQRAVSWIEEKNLARPSLDADTEEELRRRFEDDIAFVERLLGRRVDAWRQG